MPRSKSGGLPPTLVYLGHKITGRAEKTGHVQSNALPARFLVDRLKSDGFEAAQRAQWYLDHPRSTSALSSKIIPQLQFQTTATGRSTRLKMNGRQYDRVGSRRHNHTRALHALPNRGVIQIAVAIPEPLCHDTQAGDTAVSIPNEQR